MDLEELLACLRAKLQGEVDCDGLNATAKRYGVSRGGLTSFLCGHATRGTKALIAQNARMRDLGAGGLVTKGSR